MSTKMFCLVFLWHLLEVLQVPRQKKSQRLHKTPYILCCRTTTPQQWEDFSRYNKERADAEMLASTRLREAIHHTLHQTTNDLEAQKTATEYAFRKRIHEFQRAKDELEWQKKLVRENYGIILLFVCNFGYPFVS